jgi:hypothetical protein
VKNSLLTCAAGGTIAPPSKPPQTRLSCTTGGTHYHLGNGWLVLGGVLLGGVCYGNLGGKYREAMSAWHQLQTLDGGWNAAGSGAAPPPVQHHPGIGTRTLASWEIRFDLPVVWSSTPESGKVLVERRAHNCQWEVLEKAVRI